MTPLTGDFRFEVVRLPDRRTTFHSTLRQVDERLIVLSHQITPSKPFTYRGDEVIGSDYQAVWFLFKDEPYDIGRFYRPDGTWTGYYVDILDPVCWRGPDASTLQPLVDLFLDLWIAPDLSYSVLDEDELAEALFQGAISSERADNARAVLAGLIAEVEAGTFPPQAVREFEL
jgi:predicted RNA-binding protein associated with RNAse of E/G family